MQRFDFSDVDDLYREIILDHYRSPRNQAELAEADIVSDGVNPFCGDEVYLRLSLDDDVVDGVSFHGTGCSISQASASMLTQVIKGKSLEEAEALYFLFRDMMQGREPTVGGAGQTGRGGVAGGRQELPHSHQVRASGVGSALRRHPRAPQARWRRGLGRRDEGSWTASSSCGRSRPWCLDE